MRIFNLNEFLSEIDLLTFESSHKLICHDVDEPTPLHIKYIKSRLCSVERLKKETARKRLFEIIHILKKSPASSVAVLEKAQELWVLLKKGTEGIIEFGTYFLVLLEVSRCAILSSPDVARFIFDLKTQMNDYDIILLKEISKVMAPSARGRGLGGKHKKWSLEKESEAFARMYFRKIENPHRSISKCAEIVSKEMKIKSTNYLRIWYPKALRQFRAKLSDHDIERAVKKSFIEQ